MNPRTTWWLLAFATGLFAFIALVERHSSTALRAQAEFVVPGLDPGAIVTVEIVRSNLTLRAERREDRWQLTAPIQYPAQPEHIESLLVRISQLRREPLFSAADLRAHPSAPSDFGTRPARAALTLTEKSGRKVQLNFGEKTPPGDQGYLQTDDSPAILLAEAALWDQLPDSADAWRNAALLPLRGAQFDRVEVRSGISSYTLQREATNQLWQLTKPQPSALADQAKVRLLLQQLDAAQFARFVTNTAKPDLDAYGLLPPELELVFGAGTNDLFGLQLGRSPTNDPALAFARLPTGTNFALVPKLFLEMLRVPPTDWRDRRLLTFDPGRVDLVEARGKETFVLTRQGGTEWRFAGTNGPAVDAGLVQDFLAANLPQLEIARFVKDVVTDFAPYGLAKPVQQYFFEAAVTNAGGVTNVLVAQIDFGASLVDTLYARRQSEDSVYEVGLADFLRLPKAAWELLDRQVWNFSPSNVVGVAIKHQGRERKLLRNARSEWSLAPIYQGSINAFSPELTSRSLAQLRAESWIAPGEILPVGLRFAETDFMVAIEVKANGQSQFFSVAFGRRTPRQGAYAAALVNGRRMIFVMAQPLFEEVLRDLAIPPPSP